MRILFAVAAAVVALLAPEAAWATCGVTSLTLQGVGGITATFGTITMPDGNCGFYSVPYGGILGTTADAPNAATVYGKVQQTNVLVAAPIPAAGTPPATIGGVSPDTTAFASGTASVTTTTSTSLIALVTGKRIYVTSYSCANTGSTTVTVAFQDGSGGTTLWTVICPAGTGANVGVNMPMFRTTAGNALFFAASLSSTTVTVSAAGFSQ